MTVLRVLTGGVTGPLGDGFGFVTEDGIERRILLRDAWSMRFERSQPVRWFPSYKGQKHFPGRWWSATFQGRGAAVLCLAVSAKPDSQLTKLPVHTGLAQGRSGK